LLMISSTRFLVKINLGISYNYTVVIYWLCAIGAAVVLPFLQHKRKAYL